MAVLLVGCSSDNGGSNSSSSDNSSTGQVPGELQTIESLAEDAFDMALGDDFAGVADAADKIDQDWKSYRPQAIKNGAANADLTNMDDAVSGLLADSANPVDAISLARSTNVISGVMDELFALYNPKIPVAVLELDYLGRELVLDGMEPDFTAATEDLDAMKTTWNDLKPKVENAGGADEAKDFDDSITKLQESIDSQDASQLIEQANVCLELVDALESVF